MVEKEFVDDRGIRRRVYVPDRYSKPEEGMPIDVFAILDDLLSDTPLSFRKSFYGRLWDIGLITPNDFLRKNAQADVRRAYQNAISSDAQKFIQAITKGVHND